MRCPKCLKGQNVIRTNIHVLTRASPDGRRNLYETFFIANEKRYCWVVGTPIPNSPKMTLRRDRMSVACPYCGFEYDWIFGDPNSEVE